MLEYYDGRVDENELLSDRRRSDRFLMIIGIPIIIALVLVNIQCIYMYEEMLDIIWMYPCLWGVTIFFSLLVYDTYIMGRIKYGLYTDGIKVKHPFRSEMTITWEEIQEVCICYHYSIRRMKCGYVVIAFVKKGTKKNPWKRWETEFPLSYRKVMLIDYSEDVLNYVKALWKKDIPDLRDTKAYKLACKDIYDKYDSKYLS